MDRDGIKAIYLWIFIIAVATMFIAIFTTYNRIENKYKIRTKNTTYFVEEYTKNNDCVMFKDGKDSVTVCGNYEIIERAK